MDEHTYWTLPLSHNSTAREMCISIAVKLERSEEAFEMYYLDTHTGQRMFNPKNATHTYLHQQYHSTLFSAYYGS